jgi:hypothetical protein
MTPDDYRHGLLRKTLKGSFREYGRGIEPECTLEWAIGIANGAIKSGVPLDEVMGILLMVQLETFDDMRRRRLDHLRKRLAS